MSKYINKNERNSVKAVEVWFVLICFASNISQLPILLKNSTTKNVLIVGWIIIFAYIILKYVSILKFNIMKIVATAVVFDITILLEQVLTGQEYITSNLVYPVHLSLFILILSYFIGQVVDKTVMYRVSKYYIISALIVAIFIYFDTFKGTDWADSMGNLYNSKNSLAQILLIAIAFLILFYNNKLKLVKWIAIGFLAVLILMLKSRATIVGFILMIVYLSVFGAKMRSKRLLWVSVIIVCIIILLTNQQLYDLIINKIMLNNRGYSNLDTISSGRMEHFKFFSAYFPEKWIAGYGSVYLESFPLAALISYGILGAVPIFILSFTPLYVSYKYRKEKQCAKLRTMIIVLSIIMLSNGFFEELAPFGPGVKCFMLWLTTGIYLGQVEKSKEFI